MVTIENYLEGRDRKHALGPDIVEELQALEAEDEDEDSGSWSALFDPTAFTEANQPLSLDRFRLSAAELETWAQRLV